MVSVNVRIYPYLGNLSTSVTGNHLGGWHNREGVHDSVRVLLTDLGDEEGSHSRSGTTTKGVCQLEPLETITALSFFPHNIKNGIYKLSTLCVVTFCPVVSSSTLSKDKVVWTEYLSKWSRTDRVHGARFKIYKNGSWYIFAP